MTINCVDEQMDYSEQCLGLPPKMRGGGGVRSGDTMICYLKMLFIVFTISK